MTRPFSPDATAEVLVQALPYMQAYAGATVVVKFGGNAMTNPELAHDFARDIVLMHSVGIRPVVVHGGGPQIAELLNRLGKESRFVNGLRVTDAETLDVVRMVLVGRVNRDISSAINVLGGRAIGISGEDGGLIQVKQADPELGFVGEVTKVDPTVVQRMVNENMIPVISTIGADETGQAYNINADTVAGKIAAALRARRLLMLTDVDGLRREPEDPDSLITAIEADELRSLIGTPTVSGGMIPKIEGCLTAVDGGVGASMIVNGTIPHVLLLELFTDSGIGTLIYADGPQGDSA